MTTNVASHDLNNRYLKTQVTSQPEDNSDSIIRSHITHVLEGMDNTQPSPDWAPLPYELDTNAVIIDSLGVGHKRLHNLMKLERQVEDRVAGVALDSSAMKIFDLLDKETSVRWDELSERSELDWAEACRGVATLASANICEAGPARVRLSEFGDRVLAKSKASM